MRLFIALDLPASATEMLCAVQDKLTSVGIGGRPVTKDNLHLTLRFIGERDDADAQKICALTKDALRPFSAPLVALDGISSFIRSNGDTVYARLGGQVDIIMRMETALTRALLSIGIPPEVKPFMPHITLIRNANMRSMHFNARSEQFFMSSVSIYKSELLKSEAPLYTKLDEIILAR